MGNPRWKSQGGVLAAAILIGAGGGCSSDVPADSGTGGANSGTSSGGMNTGGTAPTTGGVLGAGGVGIGGAVVGVGGTDTGGTNTGGAGTGGAGTGGTDTGGTDTGGAGTGGGSVSADPTVQLGDVRQMIRGFGINNNWQALAGNADRLYGLGADGLGLNILRIGMGSNGEPYNGTSCYSDIDNVASITEQRSEPHYIMATLWSPPANCKTNNSIQDGGHLLTSCYDSWSTTIAAFADKISNNTTTTLHAMSPQNETDFASCGFNEPCNGSYDTTLFTGKEAAEFQKVVAPKLRAKGVIPMSAEASEWLHVWSNESACCSEPSGLPSSDPFECGGFNGDPIASPCTTDFGGYDYGHALAADPDAWASFDIMGTHQYDTQIAYPWPDDVPARGDKEVWQTEMSGVKWWPEQGPSDHIENGVATARWVHSALVVGEANAWLWWWYQGTSTNEGLVLQGGATAKRYYTFGNFTRYVRPGHHMVAVTGVFPDKVLVSAYLSEAGDVVIVAINETTQAQSIPLAFAGGTAPTTMAPFVTSASDNWAEGAAIAVTNDLLTASLEPMSVTTFVSQ
jgi:O-glycosyl hydrolase